jgi:uncharacterized membrane protein (UPF0127 family)
MRSIGAVLLGALALAACGSDGSASPRTVEVRVGDARVQAELAVDEAARKRGLAGRDRLGENRGMLFVYPDREIRTYWMKGMRFPIDIVWIDRGRVTSVASDVPAPQGGDVPLYPSGHPVNRVLEVPAGWAARHGVERGDRVTVGKGSSSGAGY